MGITGREVSAARRAASRLGEQGDPEAAEEIDRLLRAATSTVPSPDDYTATEAGDLLGVTGQTIKNRVARRRLSGYRIGSRIAIPQAAVEGYERRAGASLYLDDVSDEAAAVLVAGGRPTPFYARNPRRPRAGTVGRGQF